MSANSQEPLLAPRLSADQSSDTREDEDLFAANGKIAPIQQRRRRNLREIGVFVWALVATALVIVLAVAYQRSVTTHGSGSHGDDSGLDDGGDVFPPKGKRNLVFMVSDGMGPSSLSLSRSWKQYSEGLPITDSLVLDKHVIGQSRTRSSSSLVTDSAAGATAFSCGKKSYNGAISVLPDHSPCGTVMEAAKRAGYMTGLVVTTRITDATPACFAAHVNKREEEDKIAEQLVGHGPLGRVVDLMLGGGRCRFTPSSNSTSCRDPSDTKDVIEMATRNGFDYISSRQEFDALDKGNSVKLPLLGLFADHDIPYKVDRNESEHPSLVEMAQTALTALSAATQDSDTGFFLMIEGSRIDHAGHANDPVAQVHEVLEYDEAFKTVLDFLERDETNGVMVSTSDHETGGLAVARQLDPYAYPHYNWFPDALANATRSSEWLANEYGKYLSDQPNAEAASESDIRRYVRQSIVDHLGIHDVTDEEIQPLVDRPSFAPWTYADIVSRRSQTGWSTHGHSAADVNIYASSAKAARALVGHHENTEVGEFLRNYLDVDVDKITRELRRKGAEFDTKDWEGHDISWLGALPLSGERLDGQTHLDHYQGDFKKHKRCEICAL